ncbi:MAG: transcriptional regulator GcvA [Silicimonas sp.]|nr:transcriptional regulator GcvA [Silicimonas sp.]
MSTSTPPLTALRAFEAAARHMSFAQAADELHVTPAALSFQIKTLEEHLGQPVFRRLNRAVELTELGTLLAPGLTSGFSEINTTWTRARRFTDQRLLTITAGPAFTALWLAPRMFSFASQHPEIELRFSASLNLVDFDRDDVDVAIRFGQSDDTGLWSKVLIEEWMTPMMAPQMAENYPTPDALAEAPLIHDDVISFLRPRVDWDAWFTAMGVTPPDAHGPRFNLAEHAIGAAMAGVGAIMGRISLTSTALTDGRLVMPFAETLRAGASYRLVCPEGTETRPHVAAFIDWIEGEVRGLDAFREGRRFVPLPSEG